LCRARPATLGELRAVPGIGEKKLESYGRELLQVIARHVADSRTASRTERPPGISDIAAETLRLLRAGQSLEEIARARNRTTGTIADTVARLLENDHAELPPGFIAEEKYRAIADACERLGLDRLRPIKDALPPEFAFEEIRIVMGDLKRKAKSK
jgi:ATP-dependent DNA helicase RecQ